MKRAHLGAGSAALVAIIGGCAHRSKGLETSDTAPTPIAQVPLLAYEPPVANLPPSYAHLHRTSEAFFLALEIQSQAGLDRLLTGDALLRRQTTGAVTPARAGLMEISETWSTAAPVSSTASSSGRATFGPVTIIEIHTDPAPSWVTVDVARPPDVQGRWRLRFNGDASQPLIQEVVLPPAR
jgi:hypothetical protein